MKLWQKITGVIVLGILAFGLVWFLTGNWSASEFCYADKLDKGYSVFRSRQEINRDCQENHLFFPFYYFDR